MDFGAIGSARTNFLQTWGDSVQQSAGKICFHNQNLLGKTEDYKVSGPIVRFTYHIVNSTTNKSPNALAY